MDEPISIFGFAGSLRKGSYNKLLLKACFDFLPKNARLETFDLEGIPPFNQDLEYKPPEKVKEFESKIKVSDAILIVTPEYNYSIPGVLKNAIDWASRPYTDNSFKDKPVALMSASTGMIGGERAQLHLRQCFVFLNMHAVNTPEVIVTFAPKRFDDKGSLIDEEVKEYIRKLLGNLVALTIKLKIY